MATADDIQEAARNVVDALNTVASHKAKIKSYNDTIDTYKASKAAEQLLLEGAQTLLKTATKELRTVLDRPDSPVPPDPEPAPEPDPGI